MLKLVISTIKYITNGLDITRLDQPEFLHYYPILPKNLKVLCFVFNVTSRLCRRAVQCNEEVHHRLCSFRASGSLQSWVQTVLRKSRPDVVVLMSMSESVYICKVR